MKRYISLGLILTILLSCVLTGCGYEYKDLNLRGTYSRDLEGTTLTVYNWGEYISDGADDTIGVNKEFERITGIKVNYLTFESNETMYSQVKNGGVNYDIIIPSDYMIERLVKEDMLAEIDISKITNYDLIDSKYKNVFFDPENKYSVPYNVGMVGVIYNSAHISNIKHSWSVLWDIKYKDFVLNFNNPRDAFMTAQMILGHDVNTTDKALWNEAAELLKSGKKNLQAYVMDEVYGKMETGEAYIAPYYAGDYLTMVETNKDLAFFYPEEGTNIFWDAACILKDAKYKTEAEMFLNFLCRPEIAKMNAEYLESTTPNKEAYEMLDDTMKNNTVIYPDAEMVAKSEVFDDLSDVTSVYTEIWNEVTAN